MTKQLMGRPAFRKPVQVVQMRLDADVADKLQEQSVATGLPKWRIVQDALLAAWGDGPELQE